MPDITYEIVEHDGGWAYKVNGVFSETFSTHAEALSAAQAAAEEQEIPGDMETIEYEDDTGKWHTETVSGRDRPHTLVKDVESGFLANAQGCSASLQFQDEVESALPTEQCGTARVIWLAFRGLVNMSARFLEEISEELSISSGSTVGRWRSSVEAWLSARVFDRVPDCVNSQGPFLYEVHGIEGCE